MHPNSEFDFLTQETVRLSELFARGLDIHNFENLESIEKFSEECDSDSLFELNSNLIEASLPNSSGILYNIFKSGNTFSIRGFAVHNISDAFESLSLEDSQMMKVLKINANEIPNVKFFEVECYERAEVIVDQVFNKRFPMEEDVLCNISDPGFSWWYGRFEDGFRVNFRSHKFICQGPRIKLGPIGDVVVAGVRFEKLKNHFKYHLPISEVVINEKQFILKSSDGKHPILYELMNLFENGVISPESALLCELDMTLKYYLLELADVRRFWIAIEQEINTGNKSLLN